jgi:hypothetical protein
MEKRIISWWLVLVTGLALSWTVSAQTPQFPPRVRPYLEALGFYKL